MALTWFDAIGTWIGSIGTAGAMIAALHQIRVERRLRKLDEVRRSEAQKIQEELRKREQAFQINSWIDPEDKSRVLIINGSKQPIYEVVIHLVISAGAGPRTSEEVSAGGSNYSPNANRYLRRIVPPGTYITGLELTWGGMARRPGVEISFTDAQGEHWIRREGGNIQPLPLRPFDYFKVEGPWLDFPLQRQG